MNMDTFKSILLNGRLEDIQVLKGLKWDSECSMLDHVSKGKVFNRESTHMCMLYHPLNTRTDTSQQPIAASKG